MLKTFRRSWDSKPKLNQGKKSGTIRGLFKEYREF